MFRFSNETIATINTNWLTPFKKRMIEVATSTAYYEADLISQELREYSAPLVGAPLEDLIAPRNTTDESRWSLEYVLGNMVPRHVEDSSDAENTEWVLAQRRDFSFVLIRCLYSLINGAIGSKSAAASWVSEKYHSDPVHGVLGQAGARLLAYRRTGSNDLACGGGTAAEFAGLAAAVEQISHSVE